MHYGNANLPLKLKSLRIKCNCIFWVKKLLLIAVFFFVFSAPSFATEGSFSSEDLTQPDNTILLDRNSRVLRFLPDEKGERHLNIGMDEISDYVKEAFIAIEDKRFYSHSGFDPLAIGRALRDNMLHGRIVSGASTISQQTVRLIYPRKRNFWNKMIEISRSAKLESILDKHEIFSQYLNRVPMGNNIVGVELASKVYFGKGAKDLSPAEAAVIASLPKAPSFYNPYGKHRDLLLKRKDRVLHEMAKEGYLTREELEAALAYEISFEEKPSFKNTAPHFTDMLLERRGKFSGVVRTTLDSELQMAVETILRSHRGRIKSRGGTQAAALVVHNPTMEVLALAGSFSYSREDKGFNNGVLALRSAGSTIKPFLYASALDQGYTASSLLQDVLRRYRTPLGDYSPDNFDKREYGPITVRTALGNSLNISAVRMLETLELPPMYDLLKRLKLINFPEKGAEHYGLGLVIGNMEVTLEELAAAYAALANKGVYQPLRYTMDERPLPGEQIFSEDAAYIIGDILSDPAARILTFGGVRELDFPFRVSLKTGTSTRYRDGWAVGYTPEYTVAVWVGDFDGAPTRMITGAWGAGPILGEIIHLLHDGAMPSSVPLPEGVVSAEVCGISGMKPGHSCSCVTTELFIKGTEPKETCTFHENEKYFHELPAPYAGWVYDRSSRQQHGNYRLSGFRRELDEVFDGPEADPSPEFSGIRVHTGEAPEKHIEKELYKESTHTTISADKGKQVDQQHSGDAVRIVYPLPGDRFLSDEEDGLVVRLESVSSSALAYVDWFIDSMHFRRVGPPYRTYWKPEKGTHTIMAVGPDNAGDSITITVE